MKISKATILVRVCCAIALSGWYSLTFYALVVLVKLVGLCSFHVAIGLVIAKSIYTLTLGRWLVLWAVKRHPYYYLIKLEEELGLTLKDPDNLTTSTEPLTFYADEDI